MRALRLCHTDSFDLFPCDLAVVRDARVVQMTELVMPVRKAPKPMTAALVAFEMSVRADHESDECDRASSTQLSVMTCGWLQNVNARIMSSPGCVRATRRSSTARAGSPSARRPADGLG